MRRLVVLVLVGAMLAACAADPPLAAQYRCVVIPNDLVECALLHEGAAPAGE